MPLPPSGCLRHEVDAGWAWVVCAASFTIQFIVFGTVQSFGIIFISLLNEFGRSEYETAWVGSLAYGLLYLIGPLTTALCDHVGYRKLAVIGSVINVFSLFLSSYARNLHILYVTFGLLWSIGASFVFFPSLLVLRFYFYDNLSIANGISMSGAGIGTVVINNVIAYVNEQYGWRSGMRALAGMAAVLVVCGCVYLPPPPDFLAIKEWEKYEQVKLTSKLARVFDPRPWKKKGFIVLVAAMSFICFGYFVPYIHLVRFGQTLGVPISKAAPLLGYHSIAAIFGKLLCGCLADMRPSRRLYISVSSCLAMVICNVAVTGARGYSGLLAYAILMGFFDGCFVVCVPLLIGDIVGKHLMSCAIGGFYGVVAIPMALGPPVSGQLYDEFQSYTASFLCAALPMFVGAILFYVLYRVKPELTRPQLTTLETREELYSSILASGPSIHSNIADTFSGMIITEQICSGTHLGGVPHESFNPLHNLYHLPRSRAGSTLSTLTHFSGLTGLGIGGNREHRSETMESLGSDFDSISQARTSNIIVHLPRKDSMDSSVLSSSVRSDLETASYKDGIVSTANSIVPSSSPGTRPSLASNDNDLSSENNAKVIQGDEPDENEKESCICAGPGDMVNEVIIGDVSGADVYVTETEGKELVPSSSSTLIDIGEASSVCEDGVIKADEELSKSIDRGEKEESEPTLKLAPPPQKRDQEEKLVDLGEGPQVDLQEIKMVIVDDGRQISSITTGEAIPVRLLAPEDTTIQTETWSAIETEQSGLHFSKKDHGNVFSGPLEGSTAEFDRGARTWATPTTSPRSKVPIELVSPPSVLLSSTPTANEAIDPQDRTGLPMYAVDYGYLRTLTERLEAVAARQIEEGELRLNYPTDEMTSLMSDEMTIFATSRTMTPRPSGTQGTPLTSFTSANRSIPFTSMVSADQSKPLTPREASSNFFVSQIIESEISERQSTHSASPAGDITSMGRSLNSLSSLDPLAETPSSIATNGVDIQSCSVTSNRSGVTKRDGNGEDIVFLPPPPDCIQVRMSSTSDGTTTHEDQNLQKFASIPDNKPVDSGFPPIEEEEMMKIPPPHLFTPQHSQALSSSVNDDDSEYPSSDLLHRVSSTDIMQSAMEAELLGDNQEESQTIIRIPPPPAYERRRGRTEDLEVLVSETLGTAQCFSSESQEARDLLILTTENVMGDVTTSNEHYCANMVDIVPINNIQVSLHKDVLSPSATMTVQAQGASQIVKENVLDMTNTSIYNHQAMAPVNQAQAEGFGSIGTPLHTSMIDSMIHQPALIAGYTGITQQQELAGLSCSSDIRCATVDTPGATFSEVTFPESIKQGTLEITLEGNRVNDISPTADLSGDCTQQNEEQDLDHIVQKCMEDALQSSITTDASAQIPEGKTLTELKETSKQDDMTFDLSEVPLHTQAVDVPSLGTDRKLREEQPLDRSDSNINLRRRSTEPEVFELELQDDLEASAELKREQISWSYNEILPKRDLECSVSFPERPLFVESTNPFAVGMEEISPTTEQPQRPLNHCDQQASKQPETGPENTTKNDHTRSSAQRRKSLADTSMSSISFKLADKSLSVPEVTTPSLINQGEEYSNITNAQDLEISESKALDLEISQQLAETVALATHENNTLDTATSNGSPLLTKHDDKREETPIKQDKPTSCLTTSVKHTISFQEVYEETISQMEGQPDVFEGAFNGVINQTELQEGSNIENIKMSDNSIHGNKDIALTVLETTTVDELNARSSTDNFQSDKETDLTVLIGSDHTPFVGAKVAHESDAGVIDNYATHIRHPSSDSSEESSQSEASDSELSSLPYVKLVEQTETIDNDNEN